MSLSNKIISGIKHLKKKIFPGKKQLQKLKQEKENIIKRKLFYKQFISHGDLCFDVGANVGNRVNTLLDLGAKVVAIEPQESCYKILEQKFGDKIIIVKKGLGESDSVKDFYISNADTISSFSTEWIDSVKDGRFKEYNWNKVVQIEMTTLDNLIKQYGVPSFIKIDVEGYESDVLKGLTAPVKMISFEYTVPEQLEKAIECIKLIEKNNRNVECNYSIGESMQLQLEKWQSVEQMNIEINSKEFTASAFGDIYVRLRK